MDTHAGPTRNQIAFLCGRSDGASFDGTGRGESDGNNAHRRHLANNSVGLLGFRQEGQRIRASAQEGLLTAS